jgi:hypothetical protein
MRLSIYRFYALPVARTTFQQRYRAQREGCIVARLLRPDTPPAWHYCHHVRFSLKFLPPLPMDQTGEHSFSRPRMLRLGFALPFHPARRANAIFDERQGRKMATATQPVQALIDLLFQNATFTAPAAAPAANTTRQNAEPQDTVTIANTDPAGSQGLQVLAQAQFQIQEATVVAEVVNPLQVNANAAGNANAAADPAAANTASAATAAATNTLLAPAANAANTTNAANNTAQAAQQEELAQLDQVLQQLGIPPSSIPVVQQLALLLFRFDPQALLQLINALQGVTQQIGNQAPGNNANASAAPAQQNNAAANSPAGQNIAFAAQFQELELTFTAVGIEPAGAAPQAAVAATGAGAGGAAQGAALNVKA